MKWGISTIFSLLALIGMLVVSGVFVAAVDKPNTPSLEEKLLDYQPFEQLDTHAPDIDYPDWYFSAIFTYTVAYNGAIASDKDTFASQANATLNDPRGWSRLGASFQQVSSGGMFTLILSEASLVPTFAPSACSSAWSCRVGNSVIINDDRWSGASDAWNSSGGSLRDYRHMVINHEVGHWLGHGHSNCSKAGAKAPVMQQQSINLQGCVFNPWPLSGELWSGRL